MQRMHSITCEYKTIFCDFFFPNHFKRVIAIFSYQITPCQDANTNALSYTNRHVSTYILIHKGIRIIINPRRACAGRVTVVGCVCVCVCVHPTSFIRPTNDTTYLTGNEGQNICAVFSENAPLQS